MPEREPNNKRMTRDERMAELTRRHWDMETVADNSDRVTDRDPKLMGFDVHAEVDKVLRRPEEGLPNF